MLSIILLVLKIIGIILLSILGILILLLLFLLFVPISYRIEGEFHDKVESVKISGSVSWLLGIAKAVINYQYPDLKWYARFLWYKITSEDEEMNLDKFKPKKKKPKVSKSDKKSQNVRPTASPEKVDVQEEEAPQEVEAGLEREDVKESPVKKEGTARNQTLEKQKSSRKQKQESGKKEKEKFNFSKTIRELCDKIKLALEKKEEVMNFFYDKGNQYTLNKVKKECFYLWKCSKPHILNIDGELGFQDPATTGQALGYLGILYGFYGNAIHIIPNFEEQIYDGRFLIKGRTMLFPLVKSIVVLVIDKQVMKTYNIIKEFQF